MLLPRECVGHGTDFVAPYRIIRVLYGALQRVSRKSSPSQLNSRQQQMLHICTAYQNPLGLSVFLAEFVDPQRAGKASDLQRGAPPAWLLVTVAQLVPPAALVTERDEHSLTSLCSFLHAALPACPVVRAVLPPSVAGFLSAILGLLDLEPCAESQRAIGNIVDMPHVAESLAVLGLPLLSPPHHPILAALAALQEQLSLLLCGSATDSVAWTSIVTALPSPTIANALFAIILHVAHQQPLPGVSPLSLNSSNLETGLCTLLLQLSASPQTTVQAAAVAIEAAFAASLMDEACVLLCAHSRTFNSLAADWGIPRACGTVLRLCSFLFDQRPTFRNEFQSVLPRDAPITVACPIASRLLTGRHLCECCLSRCCFSGLS